MRLVTLVQENLNMVPFLSIVMSIYGLIVCGGGWLLLEEGPWLTAAFWGLVGSIILLGLGGIPFCLQFRAGRNEAREISGE